MKKYFLTPGPSELYFTVPDHLRTALQENICAISHRSKAFEQLYAHTVQQLRILLGVPASHHIVFTNSATEIWERMLQNCVRTESFHLVNGSFSKRFYEFAALLGKKGGKYEVPFGEGFDVAQVHVPDSAELICCTQNETSSGVAMPMEDIYALKKRYPNKLLVVDAVSAVPYISVDYSQIDSLFFSVQKGMGLPAGLGVWIFNDACIAKAQQLESEGISIGTYHSIPSLLEKAEKNQTPATPNVLGIYLLGKVSEDMNAKGIKTIRQEMMYKQTMAYQLFENHPILEAFVKKEAHRSHTVAVANVLGAPGNALIAELGKHGLVIGSGYGQLKASQVRIANFPTHSTELFNQLYDLTMAWKG